MNDPGRQSMPTVLLALLCLVLLVAGTGTAAAQGCFSSWQRPVVCGIQLRTSADGRHWDRARADRAIQVSAGSSLELLAYGTDQFGRDFPENRLFVGLDLESACRGLIRMRERGGGRFRLNAGTDRGSCGARLWVAGNLNLEWRLRFEVTPRARAGYSADQARYIAASLYRAILGREAEPRGLNGATAEIQRGRLENQVLAMFASAEFRRNRRTLSPAQLLSELYRGLLGREPDSAGVRTYLPEVERGRAADVVVKILTSQEYEQRMLGGSRQRVRRR